MISVKLGPERESFVESRVRAGEFASADELVDEAIRLMEQRERFVSECREKIQAGWDCLREGRSVDGETAMREMQRELAELRGTGS